MKLDFSQDTQQLIDALEALLFEYKPTHGNRKTPACLQAEKVLRDVKIRNAHLLVKTSDHENAIQNRA